MSLTPEQLDQAFTYHAPTTHTAPKYRAIADAEKVLHDAIFNALFLVREQHTTNPPAYVVDYDSVNAAARAFHVTIEQTCPTSADTSAALRCVILAKMCANRALFNAVKEIDTPIHRWEAPDNMAHLAHEQAILAGLQAAKAVALAEAAAEALYNTWATTTAGWVPWVPGGNSTKQDEARAIVARGGR